MSHIVTIKTKVQDAQAIMKGCERLNLAAPVQGTARLFSAEAAGLVIRLPGWMYPVVVDVATGEVRYDNFNGRWGKQEEFDRFLQAYAVEKAKLEARKKGYTASERVLADGSVVVQIQEH